MSDLIPISIDDRHFTIGEWLGFLAMTTILTLHCAGLSVGAFAAIWGNIWVGDFTALDVIQAVGFTCIAVPGLACLYGPLFLGFCDEPFAHGSVLLDTRTRQLILKRQHITGLTRKKSLAFADIRDVHVTWAKDEDGTDSPHLQLTSAVSSFRPIITNPADAADLPAFAARLRAELASAGWSEGRECGTPQAETALARG